jgi:hypothetical protein
MQMTRKALLEQWRKVEEENARLKKENRVLADIGKLMLTSLDHMSRNWFCIAASWFSAPIRNELKRVRRTVNDKRTM